MLNGDFFTVKETIDLVEDRADGTKSSQLSCCKSDRRYRIGLNALHPIFQAHFAGNPVMPGACIAQMIKELATNQMSAPLYIRSVKNMKFLNVINPQETPEISVQLTCTPQDDYAVSVSTLISGGERIFSKATLILTPLK